MRRVRTGPHGRARGDPRRDHRVLRPREAPLSGRRALVTSGPTHEPIDPVRYIANRSSGRQGHAIAGALARLGAETTLVSGPSALAAPPGVRFQGVESAADMLAACEQALPVDVAVCAAAVSDWRVSAQSTQKLKKNGGAPPNLELIPNPDILASLSAAGNQRPRLVVGFAAETEQVAENAAAKRLKKGCDWILANNVSAASGTFGGDDNTIHFIDDAGRGALAAHDQAGGRPAPRPERSPRISGCDRRGPAMTAAAQEVRIPVKRLDHGRDLALPAYATADSAGLDLLAAVEGDLVLRPGERKLIPSGLAIALPRGYEAQVRPRSGLALKHGISVLNAPGTIDADYRGEVGVILINLGQEPFTVSRGARIAQLVVAAYARVAWRESDELDQSARGSGGFGSTDRAGAPSAEKV